MDAGRYLFDQLKSQGIELLNRWLEDGTREDLHLDFKRKSHPSEVRLNDDDRKNYSKALSGFANSDSGIIIWGIGAPSSGTGERTKHPIHNVIGFAEYLDSFISRLVAPAVAEAENHIIYEEGSTTMGYVVSYIPKSLSSPHRAEADGLKHYYMRYGESFKIAEHYELEFMFGKRSVPDLVVFWGVEITSPPNSEKGNGRTHCHLKLGVTNQGKAIAKYVCLRVRYHSKSYYELETKFKSDLIHFSRPHRAAKENFYMITARALQGMVIYPGDYTNFFVFHFTFSEEELSNSRLPRFEIYYDLFAEDFQGMVGEPVLIQGKKVAEKIRRSTEP